VYVTKEKGISLSKGRLSDVAPTILNIMDIEQPSEMTGSSLITKNN
jgi:2,3-bisphosphoglycerate-independent phosphoglycerate mutase